MSRDEFYTNILRFADVAFKEQTGALLVFRGGTVQLFKGGWEPVAMYKSGSSGGWRFNRGDGRVDLRDADRLVREWRRAAQRARIAGQEFETPYVARCYERFLERVPGRIRRELRRYHGRTWQLYSLLARCGEPAFELSRDNRALTFGLANCWVFAEKRVQWEMRRARGLLRHRRRVIAGRLGFPESNAAVRVLGRLERGGLDVTPMLYLRGAMRDAALLRRLGHLPRINPGVVRVVSDPELMPHASQRMLLDIASSPRFDERADALAWEMHDVLQAIDARQRPSFRFRDLAHLAELLAEIELERRAGQRPDRIERYAEPPIPGVPNAIEPLRTNVALWEESVQMENCLGARRYAELVASRRLYVYRVLQPSRCSLALEPTDDDRWQIHDLEGPANAPAGSPARRAVEDWMRAHEPERPIPVVRRLPLFPDLAPHFDPALGAQGFADRATR